MSRYQPKQILAPVTWATPPDSIAPPTYVQTFNPRTFGALGDAINDDTTAIQQAVNAAALVSPATVYISRGRYKTSAAIVLPAGVSILADNGTLVSNAITDGAKVVVAGSDITIDGLKCDGIYAAGMGTIDTSFGLIDIANTTATAYKNIVIKNCGLKNSKALGIRILGNIDGLKILSNRLDNNFCSIFGFTSSGYAPINVHIDTKNQFLNNWGAGSQSGGIKAQGDVGTGIGPFNWTVDGNVFDNTGEMGIEFWKYSTRCSARHNQIRKVAFGVSVDLGYEATIIDNTISEFTYCGVEIAYQSSHCRAALNTIDGGSPDGSSRIGVFGLISSNVSSYANHFIANTIWGCSQAGIQLMNCNNFDISANKIWNCGGLVNFTNSISIYLKHNHLNGPCDSFIFIDFNGQDCSNIDIIDNVLKGSSTSDVFTIYNAGSAHTLTNLRIAFNNCREATFGNVSVNRLADVAHTPGIRIYQNLYDGTFTGSAVVADFADSSNPIPAFDPSLSVSGMAVAGVVRITVPTSGTSRWYKVLSADVGNAFYCPMQIRIANSGSFLDNTSFSIRAIAFGAPYGLSAGVQIEASGRYNTPHIEEIRYNNPASGATNEVWIRVGPSASGGAVDISFGDYAPYLIASPAAVTAEPTWATNTYGAGIENYTQTLQAPIVQGIQALISAKKGSLSQAKARLHIRGNGDSALGGLAANYAILAESESNTAYFAVDVVGGRVLLPNLGNFANDTAAATGGVPISGLYRNGSQLMVRTS